MTVLSIQNLCKNYGHIKALDNLSLTIEQGNVYGILGPNGSGKTTTLGIILDVIKANSGSFEWFGNKYGNQIRTKLGAILETPNFYPYKNAVENLAVIRHIKTVKEDKSEELLELVNLSHRKDSKFRTYSLGMKQRLAIAATLIGDPEVLIFDEPTNGLDPQGIAEVRNILTRIAKMGKTVIMASHILDEVEKICSHVAIIKNGKLLATGSVGSILSDDITIELASNDLDSLEQKIKANGWLQFHERKDNYLECSIDKNYDAARVNQWAFDQNITLTHLLSRKKSLEAEFLEITKVS